MTLMESSNPSHVRWAENHHWCPQVNIIDCPYRTISINPTSSLQECLQKCGDMANAQLMRPKKLKMRAAM